MATRYKRIDDLSLYFRCDAAGSHVPHIPSKEIRLCANVGWTLLVAPASRCKGDYHMTKADGAQDHQCQLEGLVLGGKVDGRSM
jgi:hypothetical protein